jgi:hypothetical protein
MPRVPSDNTTQFALRIPAPWLRRADRLIPIMARPGVSTTRTDVIRAAIARGLEVFEAEQRAQVEAAEDAARRRAAEFEARGYLLAEWSKYSGLPRLKFSFEEPGSTVHLTDGERDLRVRYPEALRAMTQWPDSELVSNEEGEAWNAKSGEGVDALGRKIKKRPTPKR